MRKHSLVAVSFFLFFFCHIVNFALSSIQHTKAVFLIVEAENPLQIKSFHVVKFTKYCLVGFFLKVTVIPKHLALFFWLFFGFFCNCANCLYRLPLLLL